MIAFGPVPSRRLGRSLGVNNIPYKVCSYSCVYCQVGRTRSLQAERRSYFDPASILHTVQDKLQRVADAGDGVDFLTFVPDGEPTLDSNLGDAIDLLKGCGVGIAIISNGSLIGHPEVRNVLQKADWVSIKVDAAVQETWRRINRPHGTLRLNAILEGMLRLRSDYRGILVTETMLVRDLNDDDENLAPIARHLANLKPETCFLSIPTRPPAESWVRPPSEDVLARAFQIFRGHVEHVELLIGYEGNAFTFTGDPEQDLLSITAVHPMREEAVDGFLERAKADWTVVRRLIDRGLLVETEYEGWRFYLRSFPKSGKRTMAVR